MTTCDRPAEPGGASEEAQRRDDPCPCLWLGGIEPPMVAAWAWEPDPQVVREARRQARVTLDSWGVSRHDGDDVVLILSELVGNALIHGGGKILVTLCLDRAQGVLKGGVEDSGHELPTRSQAGDDGLAEHGRGLLLVELLSTRWGVARNAHGTGKTLWFCRRCA